MNKINGCIAKVSTTRPSYTCSAPSRARIHKERAMRRRKLEMAVGAAVEQSRHGSCIPHHCAGIGFRDNGRKSNSAWRVTRRTREAARGYLDMWTLHPTSRANAGRAMSPSLSSAASRTATKSSKTTAQHVSQMAPPERS